MSDLNKIHEAYRLLKIAEDKKGFSEHGYEEYCNGLYGLNCMCRLFIELYELHLKSQMKSMEK